MVCHRMGDDQPSQTQFQNFRNFQNFQKVRPYVLENPVHWVGPFWKLRNFWTFWKFQNFQKVRPYVLEKSRKISGNLGNFGKFLEILDFLEILEFLELIFRRGDCDPSDDRPCTTTHLQRQGLSILKLIFRRISIYVYIYIYIKGCIDTPTNTITNTSTDVDHLLNAQASTSITINITRL